MTKLEMKYDWGAYTSKTDEYLAEARALLAQLKERLEPPQPALAQGSEGEVFVDTRERDGIKYVVVVNNNRQPGPYTEWMKRPTWMPYGKAQQAQVSILAPQGSVVYEFITSKKLPTEYRDGRLVVTLDLPPAGGRILCVYPAAISKLSVENPGPLTRGTPTTLKVSLTDDAGKPVTGRQLLQVTLTDPKGEERDESGWYRMENGQASVPFCPALNENAGNWKIAAVERTSGLTAGENLVVK
ncbi:MAG: hypothetical protein GX100_01495 [candidate division WS1 bacterium]|nr:hypothetical protein [candidate division WS1 bacterium]